MRVAENGVHQNLLLSMQPEEQDAADPTKNEIDTESVREKAMNDSRLSMFFRQAPPGSDHGHVGGEVQDEILRFLEMENERSRERHNRHEINISKIYELPRVIERYDWEEDDDDEVVQEAFMAKMNNSNKGGESVETFNEIKRITRKERERHYDQQTFQFKASNVEEGGIEAAKSIYIPDGKNAATARNKGAREYSLLANDHHIHDSNEDSGNNEALFVSTEEKQCQKENNMQERAIDIIRKAYDLDNTKDTIQPDGTPLKVDIEAVCVDLSLNRSNSSLNFQGRRFERHELELLSEALRSNKSVKHLNLSHCDLRSKDARIITQFLTTNKSLKTLDLSNNVITATGAVGIKKHLRENRTLKTLLLSKNYLSDKGCKVLLDMLKENASVEILALDYNGVNDQGLLLEIMKAAEQNTIGTDSNKARTLQQKYDSLRLEHEKLKTEFKAYKKTATIGMLTPQERLKRIMAKNRPRRTGKSNWKRLSMVTKLRAKVSAKKIEGNDKVDVEKVRKVKRKRKKKRTSNVS